MKLVARIKKLFGFTASELQQNNRSKLNLDLRNDNGINEEYWDDKLLKKYSKCDGKLHGSYTEYVVWNDQKPWVGI